MRISVSRERKAVRWLACAFLITLSALIAAAGTSVYRAHRERERAAALLAAEILSLRDSRLTGDGREEICRALIDVRCAALLPEREQRAFRTALLQEDLTPLADEIEAAFLENRFSAGELREEIRRFAESAPLADEAERAEPGRDEVPIRGMRRKGAAELAEEFFGVAHLFREVESERGLVACCRNAYAVFDPRNGQMTEFAAACTPGSPVLSAADCCAGAIEYLRNRQNMRPVGVAAEYEEHGIRYVTVRCAGGDALVGVREDSGSVCLFVRAWETAPQAENPAEPSG